MKNGLKKQIILFTVLPFLLLIIVSLTTGFFAYSKLSKNIVLNRDVLLAKITALRLSESMQYKVTEFQNSAFVKQENMLRSITKNLSSLETTFDKGFLVFDKNGKEIWPKKIENNSVRQLFLPTDFLRIRMRFKAIVSNIRFLPNKEPVIFIATPIFNEIGLFSGVSVGFFSPKSSPFFTSLFSKIVEFSSFKSGYAYVCDSNGNIVYHRHSSIIGSKNYNKIFLKDIKNKQKGSVFTKDEFGADVVAGFASIPNTPWKIITVDKWSEISKSTNFYNKIFLFFIFVAILISGLIIFLLLNKTITRPLLELVKITKKIGKTHNFSIRLSSKFNNEIGALYDSFNDMLIQIEQRQYELEKSKKLFFNVINSMPSLLIAIDKNNKIVNWNETAVKETKILAKDAVGQDVFEICYHLKRYEKSISKAIETKTKITFEKEIFDSRFKRISIFPLIADGVEGTVINIEDITEIERKNEQLRQSQKMEMVGILSGGLAHDFNNVLGGITGTISIMKFKMQKPDGITKEALDNYLKTIEQSAKRAGNMVQQLLSVSKKSSVEFVPVDLNFSIKHVVKMLKNSLDKSIEIKVFLLENSAVVNANPTQIEQVLLNLCINAAHSMTIMKKENEPWGGVLTISLEKFVADERFIKIYQNAKKGEYYSLSVEDNGVGIDKDIISKIFTPFFTTKEKGKGTGLGLAMTFNIVKQHLGIIDVYSEKEVGSTFKIYLPAIKKEVKNEEEESSFREIKQQEGTVLIVDDEEIMRDLAKEILQEMNFKLLFATNGEEAIEIYKKNKEKITLVLLDMVMPKKTGVEVFDEIKKVDKNVKIVLASGFRHDKRVEMLLKKGVDGFVQKPYTVLTLSKIINEVYAKY